MEPIYDQSLRLRQIRHRGRHRVAAQPLQPTNPLEAIHDHETPARRHNDDRDLLAALRQRADQPLLAVRIPPPQAFVAQVELVKLELHLQAASLEQGSIWSCTPKEGSLPISSDSSVT